MGRSESSLSAPPRVFISYSHDSAEHCDRVLQLAHQFRRDGIDARLDQFEVSPPEGWPLWCARQVLDADYVLLVCTETYRQRFLGLDQFGSGRGVKWEGKVIQNILYYEEVNTGFIPVLFAPDDERHIPETVKEASWYRIQAASTEDSGYASLCARMLGGRQLPSLALPEPLETFRQRDDASVPTQAVWEASERISVKLDTLQSAQAEHERRSARRHRILLGGLLLLGALVVFWGVWSHYFTKSIVTDPVILRAKLEQKIQETFASKLSWAKTQGSPYQEIDQLYRWRDQALARLDESIRFIQSAAEELQSSLTRKAAAVLQERGVDAALEHLQKALADEGKRHQAQSRELAEASLFKAELHEARFEFDQTRQAIQDAIQFDYTWWLPHNSSGLLALKLAHWENAEKDFKEAERFVRDPTDRSYVLNNLALLLKATNRLAEAEPLFRRSLAIDEQSYGPDHPDVATGLNNLAGLLLATNRLAEAEPLMRRALTIDEQNNGANNPKVARDLNNLAQLLKATNRLAEAEPLMRRALAIDEHNYGPNHPDVAIRLNNLAALLKDTNRLTEAEPLMRRALAIDEQSYGPDHPNVAIRLNNLEQVLRATNRFTEAEPMIRRALAIDEQSYGPDHPDVAIRLNNLAGLLLATNRLAEAEPLVRRALAINEQSYGPDHPNVAMDLRNLAALLHAGNRFAEEEPLMRRSLVILLGFTLRTGHLHPQLAVDLEEYRSLLKWMTIPEDEISERFAELGRQAGFDEKGFAKVLDLVSKETR